MVPIYTLGSRKTKRSKVSCLRKQHDGRDLTIPWYSFVHVGRERQSGVNFLVLKETTVTRVEPQTLPGWALPYISYTGMCGPKGYYMVFDHFGLK